MRRLWISCFLFTLLLPSLLFTQPQISSSQSLSSILIQDAKSVWYDAGRIFLSPLHFDGCAWLTTSAIFGGTTALFSIDPTFRTFAMRNQSSTGDNLFEIGRQYGREVYGLTISGGLYMGGLAFKNEDVRQTGLMLFESIVFAGITTTVIKSLVGRSRPYVGEGTTRFRGLQFDNDYESLPSGHSTVAFAVSSVLADRIKNIYASVGLYSLATLTALSRVYHDEHWFSDTFLGAAIGTAVGLSVVGSRDQREDHSLIRISPMNNGIRVSYMLY